MQPLRDDIDDLSMQFIEKYYKVQYDEVLSLIAKQAKRYKIAYGGDENDFFDKNVDDIFYRLGNAILAEMKELDKKEKEAKKESSEIALGYDIKGDERSESLVQDSKTRKSGKAGNVLQSMHYASLRNQRNMMRALYILQRSMKNTMESILNQKDYEQLQRQITSEADRSSNVGSEREEI